MKNTSGTIGAFLRWLFHSSINSDCVFYEDMGNCSLYVPYGKGLKNCSGYYNCQYLKLTRGNTKNV